MTESTVFIMPDFSGLMLNFQASYGFMVYTAFTSPSKMLTSCCFARGFCCIGSLVGVGGVLVFWCSTCHYYVCATHPR